MERKIDWAAQIGHRLKLRDLHVFCTVVQNGSMAKAAAQLGVSHPTISEVIAGLEHTFGVPLFDRGPHGVEPTAFGVALLQRCVAAFDELKQSARDIEFLDRFNPWRIAHWVRRNLLPLRSCRPSSNDFHSNIRA